MQRSMQAMGGMIGELDQMLAARTSALRGDRDELNCAVLCCIVL